MNDLIFIIWPWDMKNKQNNEFSPFFFIDDIFYMIIRLQT
jgi:hypothetical protein